MNELINSFPRQVAYPERFTAQTKEDFYRKLNSVNGIKPKIYFSLYGCSPVGSFENSVIDKVSFDLDNSKCVNSAKVLSDWCFKNNYRHCIIFSTGGLWIHIKTINGDKLKNPKYALKNAQEFIAKENALSIGKDPKVDDIDFHIIGDIARVSRCPGTLDINRNIYCQSITKESLNYSLETLKTLAKKQSNIIYWYGENLLDISKFDTISDKIVLDIPTADYEYKNFDGILDLPPCIQDILDNKNEKGNWRGRWLVTLYLKELGFPRNFVDNLAKKHFGRVKRTDILCTNYAHYNMVKCLNLVYSDGNLIFPSCEKMFSEGFCDGKCKFKDKLYR